MTKNIELWAVEYNDVGCNLPKNSINLYYTTSKCNYIYVFNKTFIVNNYG